MSIESDIVGKIIDTLKADSNFNSINAFFDGIAFKVQAQHYPFCEVVNTGAALLREHIGSRQEWEYSFRVAFYAQVQDGYTVTDREVTVTSHSTVRNFASNCKALFHQAANRDLGDLSGSNYTVQVQTTSPIDYGFQAREERANTYDNFADVTLVVRTMETNT